MVYFIDNKYPGMYVLADFFHLYHNSVVCAAKANGKTTIPRKAFQKV